MTIPQPPAPETPLAAPLAWIIAIVVSIATAAAILNSAVDEALGGSGTSIEEPVDSNSDDAADEEEAKPVGTRDNPAALGSTIEGDDWTVVVNSVTYGALDSILAANMLNDAPEDGYEFILINYTATYTGENADGESPMWVSIEYVTPEGNAIDGTTDLTVAPDAIDRLATLYSGASATGNIVLAVPTADAGAGVLSVRAGILADKVFVAVK